MSLTITDATIERVIGVVYERVRKFYSDGDLDASTLDVIVLTKKCVTQQPTLQSTSAFTTNVDDATAAAKFASETNRYGHGIHVHMPNLLVTTRAGVRPARGILMGLLAMD